MGEHTNRLVESTSPYLLQHAHNPVDWYPWSKEALVLAKKKQIPILLSIGYSACHWCHVMEKESFENEKTRSSKLIEEPRRSKYLSYKLEGILDSSINVCVTYDPTKSGSFVIGRTSIPETGMFSVCCAVQNMWLAARTEGIGVGWVSILSNETLRNVLHIPDHVVPVAYLCLGHVNKFESKPDLEKSGWLPRLKLDDVIYHEEWLQDEPKIVR